MKRTTIFLLFIAALFTLPLSAQLTPEEAVAGMGRGINLGNTLEPPFEGSWNNGPARESYFDAYEEAGFNNIRIPVRWDKHTASSAPYNVSNSWMDRVEEVVDWGLSKGFYITLNGHHDDWIKNNYASQSARDRYDAIWVQVAERFKDKSDKLLFEIINEPKGMTSAEVDDLNERILGIIRQTNPTRIVIWGGNMYNNTQNLFDAKVPVDDYLIAYYHAYDPWQFSGQGIGKWGTIGDYQALTNKYQSVKAWSELHDMPVHHSEFGAIHECDFNSRMRIYAHNVEQCVAKGFAFSVWDDGGDFRILNRGNNSWPEVKDILIHYYEDSPNQIFSTLEVDEVAIEASVLLEWNNRATGNGNIFIERAEGSSSNFVQIAEVAPDATSYSDPNVQASTTYTYRLYTNRADGTLLHGYPTRVRVNALVQSTYNDTPIALPGILEVEEYDNGGEGLSYHDTDFDNIPGAFRPNEAVDIGFNSGDYILEYVDNNEWIEYTVDVKAGGTYRVEASVSSVITNGKFSITSDKNDASVNFVSPGTGAWYDFENVEGDEEIDLEKGIQILRLNINNGNEFNLDNLNFIITALDVDDLSAEELGFHVSPNPTTGKLNIDLSKELQSKDLQIELLRMTGEKIITYKMNGAVTHVDLANYENGLYLLRLVGEDVNVVQKVIVAR